MMAGKIFFFEEDILVEINGRKSLIMLCVDSCKLDKDM
jgi:hypothetical protein